MTWRILVVTALAVVVGWIFILGATATYGIAELPVILVLGCGVPAGLCAGLLMSSLRVGPAWEDRPVRPSGMVGLRAGLVAGGTYYAARLVYLLYGAIYEGTQITYMGLQGRSVSTTTADPTTILAYEGLASVFLLFPAAAGGFLGGYVGFVVGEHLAD